MIGHLDFSQLEVRVSSMVWDDETFRRDVCTTDMHSSVARSVFGIEGPIPNEVRVTSKGCVFGVIYNPHSTGKQIANQSGLPLSKVKAFLDRFWATYPGFRVQQLATEADIRRTGWARNLAGRKRKFFTKTGDRRYDEEQLRQGLNFLVQGPAAELVKLAQAKTDEWLVANGYHSMLVGQVHDSLEFDCPADELDEVMPKLKEIMENPPTEEFLNGWKLTVPLVVEPEYGPNLRDLKKWSA